MTNPAGVKRLLVGVFSRDLCRPVAEVLSRLGAEHVMVVHSADGLDEISSAASSHIAEASNGSITEFEFHPEDAGLASCSLDGLEVAGVADSLELVRAALSGEPGDRADRARQLVALNAGAALYVAGLSDTIREGVLQAKSLMESGTPWQKMQALADFTASL
jgi:anthranilate phosphoribosyltransferase